MLASSAVMAFVFQSTPSARRATVSNAAAVGVRVISIHALHEESDRRAGCNGPPTSTFQSTPSARRATATVKNLALDLVFQSTPSARRATHVLQHIPRVAQISIHAFRVEGEPAGGVPRAPPSAFQSAISARRTTGIAVGIGDGVVVSTHALREESDTGRLRCS